MAALRRSRRLAQVLLWIKIELGFALGAAEVIRLPFVLGSSSGGSRFYVLWSKNSSSLPREGSLPARTLMPLPAHSPSADHQSFLATHNSVIPACPSIRQGEQAHQSQGVPRLSFFLPETDFCFSYIEFERL